MTHVCKVVSADDGGGAIYRYPVRQSIVGTNTAGDSGFLTAKGIRILRVVILDGGGTAGVLTIDAHAGSHADAIAIKIPILAAAVNPPVIELGFTTTFTGIRFSFDAASATQTVLVVFDY